MLDDLHVFAAVAQHRSFAEAARRLRVPTSTVSRRIAALEDAMGARLLQRTSRRVGLTEEGARLLARAAPLLDELAEVVEGAAARDGEPAGRLRVTAPVLTGTERIAPALLGFAARYPKVTVELSLTNRVVDLVEEGFDLAFRAGPVTDGELVARKVWTTPFALAASAGFVRHALGGRTTLKAAELGALPAIFSRRGGAWRLRRRDGTIEVPRLTERFTVDDPRVALDAAAAGLGVVCAPVDTIAARGAGLVVLAVAGRTVAPRDIYAIYPSRRLLSTRVRAALDWIIAAPRAARRP
jgi:DNA-binding transcriptional LysR family regulator